MSRLCEEFGCLPSAVDAEMGRIPVGLLEEIVLYRGYQRAKALYDSATTADLRSRLPESPLLDLVQEIEFDMAAKELERLTRG